MCKKGIECFFPLLGIKVPLSLLKEKSYLSNVFVLNNARMGKESLTRRREMNDMSNAAKQGNKIVTGLVIGSVIGVTVSLIDPATRKRTMQKFENIRDASTHIVQSYKDNPDEFKKDWKERFHNSSEAMKAITNDTQRLYKQIQSTVRERSKDLKEITDDFKQLYFQTKRQYNQITNKIASTKEQIIESSDMEEKQQLPAETGNREVIKNNDTALTT